jgi:hypothetical protein
MTTFTMKIIAILCFFSISFALAQKSYNIDRIVSDLWAKPNSCLISVNETIYFDFRGSYTQVGRPIPDRIGYKQIVVDASSLRVTSLDASVAVTRQSIQRNVENDTTFIVISFKGPQQGGKWGFRLEYTVDGILSNIGGVQGNDTLRWSDKYNTPITTAEVNFHFPFYVRDPNFFHPYPKPVVILTSGLMWRQDNIPADKAYEVGVTYSHTLSNTGICSK